MQSNGSKWYSSEERRCANDVRFTEPKKREIPDLIYICMNCSVILECHADVERMKQTRYQPTGIVQGGTYYE